MKLCTVTGSRAEFFILKNLIIKLQKDKKFKHNLIVTGSHNSAFFGSTIKDIKKNGVKINSILNLNIKGEKSNDIAKYLSLGIKKFSKKFLKIKPDLVLVLGDRYEIFSAVISAYLNNIPIAHIYGGEKTLGSLDDGIRHSISKLSNIHFVSTKEYFNRVKQLGENQKFIFQVGSMGVEAISHHKKFDKVYLEKQLKLRFNKKNILMTFHPETTKTKEQNILDLKKCLNCLKKLNDTSIIITFPGADHYYKAITKTLKTFKKENKNVFLFKSLGHDYYFSICKKVDFMIGNSSSGIIEMPSFKKATINLGLRQKGRVHSKSVISVEFNEKKILNAIKKVYSTNYLKILRKSSNPYEKKNISDKILKILQRIDLMKIKTKAFFDYKLS